MKTYRFGQASIACAATVAAMCAGTAVAQQAASGNTVGTDRVSAGTYGTGQATGTGIAIEGGGAAQADGGTAATQSDARFNQNHAMQRSTANARTDDERARSRTMTHVNKAGQARSRTMSMYKEKGEKPVIERDVSKSKP